MWEKDLKSVRGWTLYYDMWDQWLEQNSYIQNFRVCKQEMVHEFQITFEAEFQKLDWCQVLNHV